MVEASRPGRLHHALLAQEDEALSDTPLLQLRGVHKRFGAVHALRGVDFEVRSGEVMALVGDNGAGKSTLVKCVAGIYPIDEGAVLWNGEEVSIHGPKEAAALGIEVVYQDLALCDNLDVVQNMYLGRETLSSFWRLDEAKMEQRAREVLKDLSVTTITSVRQAVAGLSGGQRQSVAVAKAVLWNNKLVILDEPTAALGVAQTRQVLDLVKRLGQQGLAVVLISHNMNDVFEVADRITVLRLGGNVGVYATAQTTQRDIVEAITPGELKSIPGMREEGEVVACRLPPSSPLTTSRPSRRRWAPRRSRGPPATGGSASATASSARCRSSSASSSSPSTSRPATTSSSPRATS